MFLGSLLGGLREGQTILLMELQRNGAHLERISGQLATLIRLTEAQAATRSGRDRSSSSERMTWRDWAQIGIGIGIVIAALAGKLPLKDAIGALVKPLG